jgi:predicted dehydrogenase
LAGKILVLQAMQNVNEIGLVGIGYLGKIHLKLLKENPQWNLKGIFDIDQELCAELASKFQLKCYKSLDELIADCKVVDIVTPSNTHFEIAHKCIISGRHVFIEKPVTSTIKEAKILRELVKEAGVRLQVGHVERFNPAFIAALPFIKDPKFFEIHRLAQYNNRGTDVSVVLDLMLHDLDLLMSLVNSNIKRISAVAAKVVSSSGDMANARIEFENGCVANITTNRIALKNVRKFRVYSENNLVIINLLDKITEVVKIKNAGPKSGNMVIDPGNNLPKKEMVFEHPLILPTNAINEELNSFYESINSNKPVRVTIDDSIHVLEVAFEIEEITRLQ